MVAPQNAWDRLHRAMRQLTTNEDGIWGLAITGTVNTIGGGTGGTAMVDNNPFTPGGTSITPIGGYFGGRTIGSGNAAAPALSNSAILQVHVVAGGAGGGLSQLQIVGSDNSNFNNVGYPSGGTPSVNAVPVNIVAGGAGVSTVNIAGQPISVVGSQSVTQLGAPWSFVGSAGVNNLGGSVGVVQITSPWVVVGSQGATQLGAPWSFVGSAGVTPLAAFSLSGVPVVDPRGSLVPTQWIISAGGSGQFAIAGPAPANQRIYFTGYRFVSTGTVDVQFQSPSGVAISGSLRMLPGAGMVDNGGVNWPVLVGSQQSSIFMLFTGTQNVGGWANGYIAP